MLGAGIGVERCQKRADRECKEEGYKVVVRSDDARHEEEYFFGFNPAGLLTRTMLVICS
ncbi:hypothetical protein EMIT0196MI5_70131 [Pseudomonas sp. IT-196MI5]